MGSMGEGDQQGPTLGVRAVATTARSVPPGTMAVIVGVEVCGGYRSHCTGKPVV